MVIHTMYKRKIKHYNHIFDDTVRLYRGAVDYLISVCMDHWTEVAAIPKELERKTYVESMIHKTKDNPVVPYDFDDRFYKFPSYLRRSAIATAIGKVSSYKSNLAAWESSDTEDRGLTPGLPKAGFSFPCMYRKVMYEQTGDYTAQIKVWIHNTWDWLAVSIRKSDVDYALHHCQYRKECAPVLMKRGKQWSLDFAYEESVDLNKTDIHEQVIVAVDLGINSACTCSVMRADGTVVGRRFLKLPAEYDSLQHKIDHIKRAQHHGSRRVPNLWAYADGVNKDIAIKTAQFIADTAVLYNADTVVFEHLDLDGRKHGSKKQRLALWRAKDVQSMTTDKVHRLGIRVSRICAWGTSRLAFDGSGRVLRGKESEKTAGNYSVCEFRNGKIYNCDLNASYNIGARYFLRELLKTVPMTEQQDILAKVPGCSKRSTCTLSDLISLNAVLCA